jgi:hypothetical protein
MDIPANPFVFPNTIHTAPPSESGKLCYLSTDPDDGIANYQGTLNLSNRIKIIIPTNPIFSGIYYFDRQPNTRVWKLDDSATITSVAPWEDPPEDPPSQSLYPIELYEFDNDGVLDNGSSPNMDRYYYETLINNEDSSMSGVYGYPVKFAMLATHKAFDDIGYRLAIGFTPPLRHRKEFFDWIAVDQIPHTINGISASLSKIDPEDNTSIKHSFLDAQGSFVCSGIPEIGFAFYASGNASINEINGQSIFYNPTFFTNPEFGSSQESWFGKVGIVGIVEFVYSCREGVKCDVFNFPATNTIISEDDFERLCYGSTINIDYSCSDQTEAPNLTNTNIFVYFLISSASTVYTSNSTYKKHSTDETSTHRVLYGMFSSSESVRYFVNTHLRFNFRRCVDLHWTQIQSTSVGNPVGVWYVVISESEECDGSPEIVPFSSLNLPTNKSLFIANGQGIIAYDNGGNKHVLLDDGSTTYLSVAKNPNTTIPNPNNPTHPMINDINKNRILGHFGYTGDCNWHTFDTARYGSNAFGDRVASAQNGIVDYFSGNSIENISTGLATDYMSSIYEVEDSIDTTFFIEAVGTSGLKNTNNLYQQAPGVSYRFGYEIRTSPNTFVDFISPWYNHYIYQHFVPSADPDDDPFTTLVPDRDPPVFYSDFLMNVNNIWISSIENNQSIIFAATPIGLAVMPVIPIYQNSDIDYDRTPVNGGVYTWKLFGPTYTDSNYIVDVHGDGSVVCAATKDGLQISFDLGDTWTKILGGVITTVRVYEQGRLIIAGSADSVIFSNDFGQTFITFSSPASSILLADALSSYDTCLPPPRNFQCTNGYCEDLCTERVYVSDELSDISGCDGLCPPNESCCPSSSIYGCCPAGWFCCKETGPEGINICAQNPCDCDPIFLP